MGVVAFLASLGWYLIRYPIRINGMRMVTTWLGLCLAISVMVAIYQLYRGRSDLGEILSSGVVLTFPIPLGVILGWVIGFWFRGVADMLLHFIRK